MSAIGSCACPKQREPSVTRNTQSFTAYEDVQALIEGVAEVLEVPDTRVLLDPITAQSQFWIKRRRAGDANLTNNTVSPRIALAWDPWANGKTKLSMGDCGCGIRARRRDFLG